MFVGDFISWGRNFNPKSEGKGGESEEKTFKIGLKM